MNQQKKVYGANQELGLLIKEFRTKKKITQLGLAQIMGYTQAAFISQMECGDSKIPLETLGQLIEVLDLPEDKVISLMQKSFQEYLLKELEQGKKKRRPV